MNIGIVGGGQLARMMALAGYPLGMRFTVLDPAADACAGQVATLIEGDYADIGKLTELAQNCDAMTFDFENVPEEAVRFIEHKTPAYPPSGALGLAQDRLLEKKLFRELGITPADFAAVDSLGGLHEAVERLGLPAVLKTRRLGYDGKGQHVLQHTSDINAAWKALSGTPLILEAFIHFEREVSIIAVRGRDGETVFYPLTENRHKNGILNVSIAPFIAPALQSQAETYATKVMDKLNYVGVMAIEFFVQGNALLANEIAPRVHNSGHWTIEGAQTSQFENHIRAITGLPLGSTKPLGHCAMFNMVGKLAPREAALAIPGCHYHDYGKAPRAGRKLGHITLCDGTPEEFRRHFSAIEALLN